MKIFGVILVQNRCWFYVKIEIIKIRMVAMIIKTLSSTEEIIKYIEDMDRESSVLQFYIPGKGRFTLVLQEEDLPSVNTEAELNPELDQMIQESREQYKQGFGMTASELIKSLSPKDFI